MPEHFLQWLVAAVLGVVLTIISGRFLRTTVAQYCEHQPAELAPALPRTVVLSVMGWLAFLLLNRILGDNLPEKVAVSLWAIQVSCCLNLLIAGILPVLLTDGGRRSLAEAGLSIAEFPRPLWLGLAAYATAIWPTAMLLVLSQFWRSIDTEHAFLSALRQSADWQLIIWIGVSAVIAAPLAEELLFRVTLQGWLSERLSAVAAIGLTAALFALIHGWRDALPLVPLSLILGYVFHQTRSYWACVVTHALFNATNLMLALLSNSEA